jgi:hypothetical protein
MIKLLSVEQSCNTTANTIANGKTVRLFNNTAAAVLITQKDSANNILGTITIAANSELFIKKTISDTLEANSGILAVSVTGVY